VGGLEVLVGAVLGVAIAVVGQRPERDLREVLADGVRRDPVAFVDVVAQMDDELDVVLARQVGEGGIEAVGVVLAGDEGEPQRVRARALGRRRAGAADRADPPVPLERYQYQVSASRPATSACTVCASPGGAGVSPRRTIVVKSGSLATS
jgi:hypothetical protein